MDCEVYRYKISEDIIFRDVEESFLLAVMATESVYGRSLVRLDASFLLEREKRACVIDASTEVGRHIARIFTGFLTQEFGEEAFKVTRLERKPDKMEQDMGKEPKDSIKEEKDGRKVKEVP